MDVPLFSFGLIADVQYADLDDGQNYSGTRKRYYRNFINLLKGAIQDWNSMSPTPSFILQLGDLIDGFNRKHEGMKESSWKKTTEILSTFNGKVYHTFGNHDYYNFTHKEIAELLPEMTLSANEDVDIVKYQNPSCLRYSFIPHKDYLVIVLDTYEISLLGYDKDDENYKIAFEMFTAVNKNKEWNSHEGLHGQDARFVAYNGAIGTRQLKWLDQKLSQAETANQKVFLVGHAQVIPTGNTNGCWDSGEILNTIHKYKCVVAVFAGHDHDGGWKVDDHGIHHIVMPGIVERTAEEQAYATVSVFNDRVEVVGKGSLVPSTSISFSQS